nr:MAG TPA: hypothetical protein [Caudoviricetes sp.]
MRCSGRKTRSVLPPQLISGKKLVNNILSDFPFLTRTELTFQKYNIIGQQNGQ